MSVDGDIVEVECFWMPFEFSSAEDYFIEIDSVVIREFHVQLSPQQLLPSLIFHSSPKKKKLSKMCSTASDQSKSTVICANKNTNTFPRGGNTNNQQW